MWVYQILDIISTATEAISVYLFSSWLCKKPRFSGSTNKCIIIGIYFLSIYAMTWFTGLGAYKIPILLIVGIILIKICYADSFITCGICYEVFLISIPILTEGVGMLIGYAFYQSNVIAIIDGASLMRWEIYVITLIVRILILCFSYLMCINFTYQVNYKDFLLLTTVFIFTILFFYVRCLYALELGGCWRQASLYCLNCSSCGWHYDISICEKHHVSPSAGTAGQDADRTASTAVCILSGENER